jgi:hypothetical protein
MPHILLTVFPKLLSEIEKTIGAIATTVMAGNVHDAVMALVERNCDLLLCYDHRQQGIALDTERYAVLAGQGAAAPTSRRCLAASPYVLPGTPNDPQPFLSYSPYSSLSRIVEKALHSSPRRAPVPPLRDRPGRRLEEHGRRRPRYRLAAGQRGLREIAEGKLTLAIAPNDSEALEQGLWCDEMDIRVYRRLDGANPDIDRIWNYLKAEHGTP